MWDQEEAGKGEGEGEEGDEGEGKQEGEGEGEGEDEKKEGSCSIRMYGPNWSNRPAAGLPMSLKFFKLSLAIL